VFPYYIKGNNRFDNKYGAEHYGWHSTITMLKSQFSQSRDQLNEIPRRIATLFQIIFSHHFTVMDSASQLLWQLTSIVADVVC
jgi:hypothetical protein